MKVEEPSVAKRRYAISLMIGASGIVFAFVYAYIFGEWTTRIGGIGGEPVSGLVVRDAIIAIVPLALGIMVVGFSTLFYLGWRSEYAKDRRSRQ